MRHPARCCLELQGDILSQDFSGCRLGNRVSEVDIVDFLVEHHPLCNVVLHLVFGDRAARGSDHDRHGYFSGDLILASAEHWVG